MSNPYYTGKKKCTHPCKNRVWRELPGPDTKPRVKCTRCGKLVRMVGDRWVTV